MKKLSIALAFLLSMLLASPIAHASEAEREEFVSKAPSIITLSTSSIQSKTVNNKTVWNMSPERYFESANSILKLTSEPTDTDYLISLKKNKNENSFSFSRSNCKMTLYGTNANYKKGNLYKVKIVFNRSAEGIDYTWLDDTIIFTIMQFADFDPNKEHEIFYKLNFALFAEEAQDPYTVLDWESLCKKSKPGTSSAEYKSAKYTLNIGKKTCTFSVESIPYKN